MWTANVQDTELIDRETGEGTSKHHKRPLDLCRSETRKPCHLEGAETSDKRLKSGNACQIHPKNFKKTDKLIRDAIYKWQMCNFTKCIYDNAVNLVLDSISSNADSVERETTLNATSQDLTLENEAVLMAIEWKGLKQQNTKCSCPHDGGNSSRNDESLFSSKANNYFFCSGSQQKFYNPEPSIDPFYLNDENQESNFENSFMTTAVSAAIEEKGLSMYPV